MNEAATYNRGFDDGRAAVLYELVCSVCGWNHDRDESAACEGCEAVTLEKFLTDARERLQK